MGNCMGKNDLESEYREEHMPIAKQLADSPRKLSNGDTLIPVNYIDGSYPTKYPIWLIEDLSPKKWSYIIQRLNNLNSLSPLWDPRQIEKYKKLSTNNKMKAQSLMNKDKQKLNRDLNKLLKELNRKILNPRSLNASSNLNEKDVKPSTMGIIINYCRTPRGQNKTKKTLNSADDSEGKFIILPDYDQDDYIYNVDEALPERDESVKEL
eukprot:301100_1